MGIIAIFLALRSEFLYSAVLIVFAVAIDGLDGKVARSTKRKGNFGVELDSLSDLLVFGGAVAIFGYAAGLTSYISMIILGFFVVAGALRLARFNITKDTTKGKYFEGTPIPLNAIIPVIYLVIAYFSLSVYYLLIPYLILAITMISSFRVKKFS